MYGRLVDVRTDYCLVWGNGSMHRIPYEILDAEQGDFVRVRAGVIRAVARGSMSTRGEAVRMMQSRAQCMRLRARILREIRDFFRTRHFLEVHTPVLAASGGMDVHIDQFMPVGDGFSLITSPEFYMKRLLAGGEERIFQIGPAFRLEPAGDMHNPEFTILEFYRAWTDYNGIMDDLEAMVKSVCRALDIRELRNGAVACNPYDKWPRLTVGELLAKSGVPLDADEERINRAMAEWDGKLGEGTPVFVKDYPSSMASLAAINADTGLAERFELYVAGVELANGFTELRDADEQLDRFVDVLSRRRQAGMDLPAVDTRFIAALAEGIPLVAGVAVGVDRLVALIAHSASIEPCMAFSWSAI